MLGRGVAIASARHHADRRRLAEKDVLRHVELRHEAQLLADEADAERQRMARPLDPDRAEPVDLDRACVGRHDSEHHLHQGRLAGAVLAQERMDLAAASVRSTPVQHADAAEGLGDARASRAPAGDRASRCPSLCAASSRVAYWTGWSMYLATLSLVRTAAGETTHGRQRLAGEQPQRHRRRRAGLPRRGNSATVACMAPVGNRLLGLTDAVRADHRDLVGRAGVLHRLVDAERHAVIVGVDPDEVRMLAQDVARRVQCREPVPVAGLARDQTAGSGRS